MTDEKVRRNAQMERFASVLEDVVREINPEAEFTWRKMFGGSGYYVNGVMFSGMYIEETIGLKLSDADCEALLKVKGAKQGFGKNTIDIPESMLTDESALKIWVSKSLSYAASRPAKKKKKKE